MKLDALVDPTDLASAIASGHVRVQDHPALPLRIFNYTQTAQFENVWTPVTRACRGLIVDAAGDVVARPFLKFFNYGQVGAAPIALDAPVSVTDKADGSLGILYPTPEGYAVATRGSFTSDQAQHATDVYRARYAGWRHDPALTLLFEIVYPANRIVLDYGGLDDLILLGAIETTTGRVIDAAEIDWPGIKVVTLDAPTFADALAIPPRPNAEGLVVRCRQTGGMLKIKQEDYVALHRIVTGLNARTVWEHLVGGAPLDDLIVPLPDEFHPWVRTVADGILGSVEARAAAIADAYRNLMATLPEGWTRREFAARAVRHEDKWGLFAMLDGKDPRPQLLKLAKPEAFITPTRLVHNEDNA